MWTTARRGEGEGHKEEREMREKKSEKLKGERWVSEEKCTPDNALSISMTFFFFQFLFHDTYLQVLLRVLCILLLMLFFKKQATPWCVSDYWHKVCHPGLCSLLMVLSSLPAALLPSCQSQCVFMIAWLLLFLAALLLTHLKGLTCK